MGIGGIMQDVGELAIDVVGVAFAPETGGLSMLAASKLDQALGGGDNSSLGQFTNLANGAVGIAGDLEG